MRGIAWEDDGCCWKVFSTRNITLSIFNYEFQSIVGFGGVIGGSHLTRLLIDYDVGGLELMTKLRLGFESVLPEKYIILGGPVTLFVLWKLWDGIPSQLDWWDEAIETAVDLGLQHYYFDLLLKRECMMNNYYSHIYKSGIMNQEVSFRSHSPCETMDKM